MRIIIEGCDKTGKSTLTALLQKELGTSVNIFKTSAPKTDSPFQEYVTALQDTHHKTVIFDRCFVGENVYGPLYRGKGLSPEEFEILAEMTKHDIHILCETDVPRIVQKFQEDKEDFTQPEDVQFIVDMFREEYKKIKGTVFYYNYATQTPEQLLIPIIHLVKSNGI